MLVSNSYNPREPFDSKRGDLYELLTSFMISEDRLIVKDACLGIDKLISKIGITEEEERTYSVFERTIDALNFFSDDDDTMVACLRVLVSLVTVIDCRAQVFADKVSSFYRALLSRVNTELNCITDPSVIFDRFEFLEQSMLVMLSLAELTASFMVDYIKAAEEILKTSTDPSYRYSIKGSKVALIGCKSIHLHGKSLNSRMLVVSYIPMLFTSGTPPLTLQECKEYYIFDNSRAVSGSIDSVSDDESIRVLELNLYILKVYGVADEEVVLKCYQDIENTLTSTKRAILENAITTILVDMHNRNADELLKTLTSPLILCTSSESICHLGSKLLSALIPKLSFNSSQINAIIEVLIGLLQASLQHGHVWVLLEGIKTLAKLGPRLEMIGNDKEEILFKALCLVVHKCSSCEHYVYLTIHKTMELQDWGSRFTACLIDYSKSISPITNSYELLLKPLDGHYDDEYTVVYCSYVILDMVTLGEEVNSMQVFVPVLIKLLKNCFDGRSYPFQSDAILQSSVKALHELLLKGLTVQDTQEKIDLIELLLSTVINEMKRIIEPPKAFDRFEFLELFMLTMLRLADSTQRFSQGSGPNLQKMCEYLVTIIGTVLRETNTSTATTAVAGGSSNSTSSLNLVPLRNTSTAASVDFNKIMSVCMKAIHYVVKKESSTIFKSIYTVDFFKILINIVMFKISVDSIQLICHSMELFQMLLPNAYADPSVKSKASIDIFKKSLKTLTASNPAADSIIYIKNYCRYHLRTLSFLLQKDYYNTHEERKMIITGDDILLYILCTYGVDDDEIAGYGAKILSKIISEDIVDRTNADKLLYSLIKVLRPVNNSNTKDYLSLILSTLKISHKKIIMIDRSRNIETLVNWISSQNIGGVGQIKDETFLLITQVVSILCEPNGYIEYLLVDTSMSLVRNMAIDTRKHSNPDITRSLFGIVTKVLDFVTAQPLTPSKRTVIKSICGIIQENLNLLFSLSHDAQVIVDILQVLTKVTQVVPLDANIDDARFIEFVVNLELQIRTFHNS